MTTSTPSGTPINILVVDDERNIRKTLSICLETEAHHVTAVSNFRTPSPKPPAARSTLPSSTSGWAPRTEWT